jgi:transcription-repair coupling factor (superfamily II helicase)
LLAVHLLGGTPVDPVFQSALKTPVMQSLRQRVETGESLSCSGVHPAAQPFLAWCINRIFPERTLLVVTDGVKTQESFHQDMETWFKRGEPKPNRASAPLFYPSWEILPHESRLPHADVISERLQTIVSLSQENASKGATVVTNVAAIMQRTFLPGELGKHSRTLKKGDRFDPLDLIEWLEEQGYEPEAQVTQKGEIALRGGIIDVYSLPSPWPVRLEFFGDELDSLRYFDPHTQMSREPIEQISIPPVGELAFLKNKLGAGKALATLLDYVPPDGILVLCEPAALLTHAEAYEAQVPKNDPFFCSWTDFLRAAEAKRLTLLNLLETHQPEQFSGFESGAPGILKILRTCPEWFRSMESGGAPVESVFASLESFRPSLERAPEPQVAEAQRREFFNQLHRWLRQGYRVEVFCNNDGEKQRFEEVWAEYGLNEDKTVPKPSMEIGSLARGFLFEEGRLVVVTDAEVFGRYKVHRPRRLKSPHAAATRSALDIDFGDLEPGDYVVHLQHGIGRYVGLEVMPHGSGQKGVRASEKNVAAQGPECLVIEYAPSDADQAAPRLYVPVTEAHLVSKYVGTGKARPPLHTLGGTRWAKAKEQAAHAVRDLASELLAMQAARESLAGHAFGEDTPWQREFESSFIYEETPDQMKAIIETKRDLEMAKPMDRLICGDVGYGKTEVAIRAAFKTVMGGKQVAVLVPTTILAQQHYNNFRERMADYPIRVEQLSRFRTKTEQRKIVESLGNGSVDIVIGTHRLVQEDISFKDLGLVVIDEEQRFGVLHKEKLKLLRKLVDVLTLSATPIPRTLYLALTGARDMSTIETPPQDRLPVETIVAQYDERIIRDAIQRELNRGGQTYFLHNRVLDIYDVARKVATLVPKARIVVGHGQMESDDLEDVMRKFINGDADVLVSTTIIESGIDIPNANTIIIDRADRFGLSDLYQLRGRVGRYKHQAYAYLMLPRHAALLSDVRKRISAIKQYSSLGSGFKIAMRDLEIRGAGNLLGSQQSGHITAVGFELYCQLLKQSVSTLKGEKVKRRPEVTVRFDFLALNPGEETTAATRPKNSRKSTEPEILVPRETAVYSHFQTSIIEREHEATLIARSAAYIPLDFISEAQHRIEIYRKLAQATDKSAIESMRAEIRDRFGKPPPAVELLLQVTELKILAGDKNVTIMETEMDKLKLTRHGDYLMVGGKFPRLTKKDPKARLNEIKKLLLAL